MADYRMYEEDRQFARRWAIPDHDPEALRKHQALPAQERLRLSDELSREGCIAYHPSGEPDELQFHVKARKLGLLKSQRPRP